MVNALPKKSYYVGRKSEYRNNYLPFDYYDFWITAKENESLRFRNKVRDYVHTPFDWDEDQDIYIESTNEFDHMNQGTQTTDRPRQHFNKHGNHKNTGDYCKVSAEDFNKFVKANNQQHHGVSFINSTHNVNARGRQAHSAQNKNKTYKKPNVNVNQQYDHYDRCNEGVRISSAKSLNHYPHQPQQVPAQQPLKSALNRKNRKNSAKRTRSSSAGPTANRNRVHQNQNQRNQNAAQPIKGDRPEFYKSISNISVQTPHDWVARDYRLNRSQYNPNLNRARSASLTNLQPKRAPFANYGWATKTKDLSQKPTHNALANKNLAKQQDREAIIELTLHRLKRDAAILANEYNAVRQSVTEHQRSDSRGWNSEYDEKYPDYSKSGDRYELYLAEKPNRLTKSSLAVSKPLRREPSKSRINYCDHY